MFAYYTAVSALLLASLAVLCLLAREDDRVNASGKRMYYITFSLIALSLASEWAGALLSSDAAYPTWALRLVKCLNYILTPTAGGALVWQLSMRGRRARAMAAILAANAVFQVISLFTGWMLVVGEGNSYAHGPLYFVYMIVYVAVFALAASQFVSYGRAFRKQNRASLFATLLVVAAGVLMQEILGGEVRTAYVALTLGAALLFIHSSELVQQTSDERISEQEALLMTDALTGLLSRHAYSKALDAYADGRLPRGFAAFSIDVNGLKDVNDGLGHAAGDELIRGAAGCIERVLGDGGRCFRTGGDEFVALLHVEDTAQADALVRLLKLEAGRWRGGLANGLSLSAGYALAADHDGCTCEELVRQSDLAMYDDKAAYYRESGRERRRR